MGAVATVQEVGQIQDLDRKIRKKMLHKGHTAQKTFADIIGSSAVMRECKKVAQNFARVDSTILILGKTGTGKEVFAQSIHNASRRAANPFVAVNCAALPSSLLESELFGYTKGAFTGARNEGKAGIFELAHTGTIFLDEISEIPRMCRPAFSASFRKRRLPASATIRSFPWTCASWPPPTAIF
jgi:transcriptional regulator with PAS, ATPase and Fis domain